MLKWIQDEYGAEVVCADRQPRPARARTTRSIEGKALQLGAIDCHVVDAREEFAREYRRPGDQGQRALRRRLPAVHRARAPADRQAGRRVRAQHRLRHDRPRLHRQGQRPGAHRGDDRHAGARAEGDRARCAPGRWAARRRSPTPASTASRSRAAPRRRRTRSTTTSGAARSEGRWIEDLDHAPEDDVFQLVTRPEVAPDEPETVTVGFERGRAGGAQRRAARARRRCSKRSPRSAPATASGSSTTSRTGSSG